MPRPRKGETSEQARERRRAEAAGGAPDDLESLAEPKPKATAPSKRQLEQALRDQRRIIAEAVAIPFRVIARKRGPHWALDEAEKMDLGAAVTEVMIAYLPPDLAKHFPLVWLGASLSAIVAKRLERDTEILVIERPQDTGAVN